MSPGSSPSRTYNQSHAPRKSTRANGSFTLLDVELPLEANRTPTEIRQSLLDHDRVLRVLGLRMMEPNGMRCISCKNCWDTGTVHRSTLALSEGRR